MFFTGQKGRMGDLSAWGIKRKNKNTWLSRRSDLCADLCRFHKGESVVVFPDREMKTKASGRGGKTKRARFQSQSPAESRLSWFQGRTLVSSGALKWRRNVLMKTAAETGNRMVNTCEDKSFYLSIQQGYIWNIVCFCKVKVNKPTWQDILCLNRWYLQKENKDF